MIGQGFPLWAVDEDGVTYAVVGWEYHGPGRVSYPVLASVGYGTYVEDDQHSRVFTFTTTDPRAERPDVNKIAYEAADLRQRLTALAHELKESAYAGSRSAALLIEKELNR